MALITLVEIAINYAPLATTDYSRFFLNYGYHQISQWDLAEAMEVACTEPLGWFITRMSTLWAEVQQVFNQQKQRSTATDKRRRDDYEFHVGQQVLVSQHRHQRLLRRRGHPLNPKAVGPFTIQRQITRNTFVLESNMRC